MTGIAFPQHSLPPNTAVWICWWEHWYKSTYPSHQAHLPISRLFWDLLVLHHCLTKVHEPPPGPTPQVPLSFPFLGCQHVTSRDFQYIWPAERGNRNVPSMDQDHLGWCGAWPELGVYLGRCVPGIWYTAECYWIQRALAQALLKPQIAWSWEGPGGRRHHVLALFFIPIHGWPWRGQASVCFQSQLVTFTQYRRGLCPCRA